MLRDVRRQRDKEWGTRGSVAQAGYRTMDKLVLGVLGEATPVFFFFLLLSGCLRRYEFQNGAITFALVQRVTALCRPNAPRRRVVHTQLSSVGFFSYPFAVQAHTRTHDDELFESSVACAREP